MKTNQFAIKLLVVSSMMITLILASCTKSIHGNSDDDSGQVSLKASTDGLIGVVTKAATYNIPSELIPDVNDFSLHLLGTYLDPETNQNETFDHTYTELIEYNSNLPMLPAGEYSAKIYYGDKLAEGENKPYFEGSTTFTVIKRKKITENMTASVANSIFTFETGEWFRKYYKDASFTITDSNGGTYTFDGLVKPLIFTQVGATLTIKGSATKISTGSTVEFPLTSINGVTKVKTLSTVVLDMEEAGTTDVTITFDDNVVEATGAVVELNPSV